MTTPAAARQPLSAVDRVVLPYIDNQSLIERDRAAELAAPDVPMPMQTAEPVEVSLDTDSDGTWEALPGGDQLWRLRIRSEGAVTVAVKLEDFFLPPSASLVVTTPRGRKVHGPYTTENTFDSGDFWIPKTMGDELVLELRVSAAEKSSIGFHVAEVNHGYQPIIYTPCYDCWPNCDGQLTCNIDTACIDDPDDVIQTELLEDVEWSAVKRAIGNLDIGNGRCNCSGALMNSTSTVKKPLFMTASHCFRQCASYKGVPVDEGLWPCPGLADSFVMLPWQPDLRNAFRIRPG